MDVDLDRPEDDSMTVDNSPQPSRHGTPVADQDGDAMMDDDEAGENLDDDAMEADTYGIEGREETHGEEGDEMDAEETPPIKEIHESPFVGHVDQAISLGGTDLHPFATSGERAKGMAVVDENLHIQEADQPTPVAGPSTPRPEALPPAPLTGTQYNDDHHETIEGEQNEEPIGEEEEYYEEEYEGGEEEYVGGDGEGEQGEEGVEYEEGIGEHVEGEEIEDEGEEVHPADTKEGDQASETGEKAPTAEQGIEPAERVVGTEENAQKAETPSGEVAAADEIHQEDTAGGEGTVPAAEEALPADQAGHPEEALEAIPVESTEHNEEEIYEDDEMDDYPIDIHALPPIILHLPGLGARAVFNALPDGGKLPVWLEGRVEELGEASLSDVWAAIKKELTKEKLLQAGEMIITEKQMELKMGEDDVNLQSITMLELAQVHYGCGLPGPVQLYITFEPHRFITRFNAIQQEVQAQLGTESEEAEDIPIEDEVKVGEEHEMEESMVDDTEESIAKEDIQDSRDEKDNRREEYLRERRERATPAEHGSRKERPTPVESTHPNADWAHTRPIAPLHVTGSRIFAPRKSAEPELAESDAVAPPQATIESEMATVPPPSGPREVEETVERKDDQDDVESSVGGNKRFDEEKDTIDSTESEMTESYFEVKQRRPLDYVASEKKTFDDDAILMNDNDVDVDVDVDEAVPKDEVALLHEEKYAPASTVNTPLETPLASTTSAVATPGLTTNSSLPITTEAYASTEDASTVDGLPVVPETSEKTETFDDEGIDVTTDDDLSPTEKVLAGAQYDAEGAGDKVAFAEEGVARAEAALQDAQAESDDVYASDDGIDGIAERAINESDIIDNEAETTIVSPADTLEGDIESEPLDSDKITTVYESSIQETPIAVTSTSTDDTAYGDSTVYDEDDDDDTIITRRRKRSLEDVDEEDLDDLDPERPIRVSEALAKRSKAGD